VISIDPTPLLIIDIPATNPPSLCSYIAGFLGLVAQSAATCSRIFLPWRWRRYVGSIHKIYTAPHPRRRHSSKCRKFMSYF
jgi:hypothetical protein